MPANFWMEVLATFKILRFSKEGRAAPPSFLLFFLLTKCAGRPRGYPSLRTLREGRKGERRDRSFCHRTLALGRRPILPWQSSRERCLRRKGFCCKSHARCGRKRVAQEHARKHGPTPLKFIVLNGQNARQFLDGGSCHVQDFAIFERGARGAPPLFSPFLPPSFLLFFLLAKCAGRPRGYPSLRTLREGRKRERRDRSFCQRTLALGRRPIVPWQSSRERCLGRNGF